MPKTTRPSGSQFKLPQFKLPRIQSRCSIALLLITLALPIAGCGDATEPKTLPAQASSQTQLDDVTVSLTVTPNPARLSDVPSLTLTVDAPADHTIKLPVSEEELGDFLVRDVNTPLPKTNSGRQIHLQIYELEPTFAGSLQIAPLAIGFQNAAGESKVIETEPLQIEILSLIANAEPSLEDLDPMEDPVEIPNSFGWLSVFILLLITLTAGIAARIFWRSRKQASATSLPKLTPREQALLDLEQLLKSGLSELDVKQFFVALTGIVRHFIEATTNVQAAEQTTAEFLAEIARNHQFPSDKKKRLQAFLESADLIKYAAFQPRGEDIEEAVSRAREFIGSQSNNSVEQSD
ncbi:MAG: hypothetical protein ACI9HK_000258 [Pirellulaceae bacterium]|jgi:hypothetical protein